MAELAVGMARSVVAGALTKAKAAIQEEAKLRESAQRNMVLITGELEMMESLFEIADGGDRLENPVVKTWVRQTRELAYDVEDCIEFVVQLDMKNRWWIRLLKPVSWFTPCVNMELPLDQAVAKLEQLKARVEDVSSRNVRYSLINSDSGSGSKPAAPAVQPASAGTVGVAAVKRLIEAVNTSQEGLVITSLLPKIGHDLGVISIWGTGGSRDVGMASIAWNAFIDQETCQNFVCRAWVKLIHPFDPNQFVRSLKAQFSANLSSIMKTTEEATRDVDPLKDFEQLLTENRYLVVLEDLSTVAEWAAIRSFFPNKKNGSCIILSTQQFEVASLSVGRPYQVFHLNQLQAEHSVYAFSTEGSQYDGDSGVLINCKKNAAKRWTEEHPLVGRESEMKNLFLNVVKARAKSYQVISVFGFAVVGISALVMNIFCGRILKDKYFQKYGWVDVSHPFSLRDFSQTLLLNFRSDHLQDREPAYLYSMGSTNPIAECREILEKHRCLVVIDGLQSMKEWDLIKADLVSGSNSRNVIIVITTELEVVTHCHGDKIEMVYTVNGLEADAAVELFEKVSTKGEVAQRRELALICGGLPKVIVEIAGSFNKNTNPWKDVLSTSRNSTSGNSMEERKISMQQLEKNRELDSLKGLFEWMKSCLRYYPNSLKPCVLYLPVFPRNHFIRRNRLIRRWIAEGYSSTNHDQTAEMTGEKQFHDLLDLRIIQQPGNRKWQVNGFFREYIVSHQTEENFVFELTDRCVFTTQRMGRHLVISERWVRDRSVFESIDFYRLRSLTVFGRWESFFISESMKQLQVLDLEDASKVYYSDLKKMLKLLRRLKFLSLRGCHEIYHLPSSIGGLRQLQSLDVRNTSIVTLPVNISKLQVLRYIRAGTTTPANKAPKTHHVVSRLSNCIRGRYLVGCVVPRGIGKLTMLHTLGVVNVSASGTEAVLKELKKLIFLHKLAVSGINRNNSNKFFIAIEDLICLESLSVQLEDNNQGCLDDIRLPWYSMMLRSLKLHGLGDRLPNWSSNLIRLTKMVLEIANLTGDQVSADSEGVSRVTPEGRREPTRGVIKFLSELPELCILRLRVHHLKDNRLDVCVIKYDLEEDSFEKLKVFEIACTSSSSSIVTFGEKTMKKLEQLTVDCYSGSSFLGLEQLPQLRQVLLKGASDEALKCDLIANLINHPKQKKPVVNLEELTTSS